jgi:3'-phosphoadenosine 5'-phosphosulfate sulfotransferase (PAPS reductase)/FAD synthetase
VNPYRIEGPALISFSGGRTSAYMLHEILKAWDSKLPDDVHVCFANTGKEREETLRFVHECGSRWGVRVRWLEWRPAAPGYEEVGFNSASRAGEPFEILIEMKQRLPNWQERWCTQFLKVRPMFALMRSELGLAPGQYTENIGFRDDEGARIYKGFERADREGRRVAFPLASAKIRKPDVLRFWLGDNVDPKNLLYPLPQGFDLGLYPWEGNCDLCFLKGRAIRKRIIRDDPRRPHWWVSREQDQGGLFDRRDSIADLVREVREQGDLIDGFVDDGEERDAECGLMCVGDAA